MQSTVKDNRTQEATKTTQWHPSMSVPLSIRAKRNGMTTTPCTLSEVYKLRSNNPKNKNLVEIHKDNRGYSIKFTVDKTIPEFNQGAESANSPGSTPSRSSRICSRDNTGLRGSRCSTSTSRSLSTQRGQFRAIKIVTRMRSFVERSRSFFSGH